MASAQREIMINAPPHKVWSLLGEVDQWPAWHSKITQGRMLAGDEFFPGAKFQYVYDGEPTVGTITQIDRLNSVGWRTDNSRFLFQLEASEGGTRVSGTHEISGFLEALRKGKFQQEADRLCNEWLTALKEAAEAAQ